MNARQMTAWLRYGDGMALAQETFRPFNVHFLPFGDTGTQMGGWFRREIRSLEDLRSLLLNGRALSFEAVQHRG
jgi:TRAP-type mannitol/chloroaromatic compound transport system substrate-binding protein